MPTEDSITSESREDRHRARARAYYHAHPERCRASRKLSHEANKEAEKAKAKVYRKANREKCLAAEQAYRKANPEKTRALSRRNWFKRKYGITAEMVNEMNASQDGRCWICRTSFGISGYHIDHCHATGKVRGLLCRQCNNGLGQFGDNPSVLRRAIKYLQAHAEVV